jgi:peroxiredoxin
MKKLIAFTLVVSSVAANAGLQEACECKPLPKFSAKASDGKTYSSTELVKKPTVVFFLKAGCPHNPKSAPLLNKLKAAIGPKVNFVAVTNLTQAEAAKYAKELGTSFPLLADADKKIVKGFGVSNSLDFALLCPDDKKVAKTWHGYNRKIMGEFLTELANHKGPKKVAFDLNSVPKGLQSGCGF